MSIQSPLLQIKEANEIMINAYSILVKNGKKEEEAYSM